MYGEEMRMAVWFAKVYCVRRRPITGVAWDIEAVPTCGVGGLLVVNAFITVSRQRETWLIALCFQQTGQQSLQAVVQSHNCEGLS